MSRYVKTMIIKANEKEIYNSSIEHFTSLGYSIEKSSPYNYLEFKRGGKIFFVVQDLKAPHTLTIILTPHDGDTYVTFKFECLLCVGRFNPKSQKEADEYIFTLVRKIYENIKMKKPIKMKTCPNCGRKVPIDALFCPYCGYKFPSK